MKKEHAAIGFVFALLVGILIGRYGLFVGERPVDYEYVVSKQPVAVAEATSDTGANSLGIAGSPTKGPADAKVTIIESSDFQ